MQAQYARAREESERGTNYTQPPYTLKRTEQTRN